MVELRDYQKVALDGLRNGIMSGHLRQILCLPTGSGKCVSPETPVLLYNGQVIRHDQVEVGMDLMGPDSLPRKVLSVSQGQGPMFDIVPEQGDTWRCNDVHVLSLVCIADGSLIDVPLDEYQSWDEEKQQGYKLFRVGVDFMPGANALPVEPYLLGLIIGSGFLHLGDKTSVCVASREREVVDACLELAEQWNMTLRPTISREAVPARRFVPADDDNKLTEVLRDLNVYGVPITERFIPEEYLTASRQCRLAMLAGLLDVGAEVSDNGFDYYARSSQLVNDILFLARSCGFFAKQLREADDTSKDALAKYHVVQITGDMAQIPCRVSSKVAPSVSDSDALTTSFTVVPAAEGTYCGFTIDGDGRYLLGDFTATHNTIIAAAMIEAAVDKGSKVAFICDRIALVEQTSMRLTEAGIKHGVAQGENTYGRTMPIQVVSAQTIEKRGYLPDVDMLVIDECFPPDTELLTEDGWVRFDNQHESGRRVAQVDEDGLVSFVMPKRYIRRWHDGEMVRLWSSRGIDLLMTPNHEMLLQNTHSGDWYKQAVQDVVFHADRNVAVSGLAPSGSGDLTPYEQLMIALQAHGSVQYRNAEGASTLLFSLSKESQIAKLMEICKAGDFSVKEIKKDISGPGRRRFIVHKIAGASRRIWDHFSLATLTQERAVAIITDMMAWDCTVVNDTLMYYNTSDVRVADFYQAVACLAGYRARLSITRETRQPKYSDRVRLFVSRRGRIVSTRRWDKKTENYTGYVHCVTVPAGNIIVRAGGKTLVVGNCHTIRRKTMDFAINLKKPTIGLTATPFTKGLGRYYSNLVTACTTDDLLEQNWLAPLKVYNATQTDMTGAPVNSMGEWATKTVDERAIPIVGDVVSDWVKYTQQEFNGPVKTLVFSSSVAHGEELITQFNAAGYRFEQISYRERSDESRKRKIRALRTGRIHGLVSCEALAKGFDLPDVRCLVSARPYRVSLASVIQQLGRGMRAVEGKDFCLLLDHVSNYVRHAPSIEFFWANGHTVLDDRALDTLKKKSQKVRVDRECYGCGLVMPPGSDICPGCGRGRPVRPSMHDIAPGKMVQIDRGSTGPADVWPYVSRWAVDRYPDDWDMARKRARGAFRDLTGKWPDWNRSLQPASFCPPDVVKDIQKAHRRWIKSQSFRD